MRHLLVVAQTGRDSAAAAAAAAAAASRGRKLADWQPKDPAAGTAILSNTHFKVL